MKKFVVIALMFSAFGCAKTASVGGQLSPNAKTVVASAATAATCENAVADQATETQLEQDPTVSDQTVCTNRKNFGQKYQGLTCNFSETQQSVAIQPVDCDASVVHESRAQTLAEKPDVVPAQGPDLGFQTKRE